jgi:hypothetical protein
MPSAKYVSGKGDSAHAQVLGEPYLGLLKSTLGVFISSGEMSNVAISLEEG